jgi:hypothetical protein
MLYIILWILVGLSSSAIVGYIRYNNGRTITLTELSQLIIAGLLLGPIIAIIFLAVGIIEFYEEHGNKAIFKKEE